MASLVPISEKEPCGEADIEYKQEFISFRDEFSLLPLEQNRTKTASTDWRQVRSKGYALLRTSVDIRLLVLIATAELLCDGLDGFTAAVGLLGDYCEQFWKDLHPQPDADDPTDTRDRMYAIEELATAPHIVRLLREQAVASHKLLGSFTVRDVLLAENKLNLTSNSAPAVARPECEAILREAGPQAVEELRERFHKARQAVARLRAVTAKAQPPVDVNVAPLLQQFDAVLKFVDPFCSNRAAAGATLAPAEGAADAQATSSAWQGGQSALAGPLSSREDVVRALEGVIDYYKQHEPSSPVPLLVARVKRLVPLDFMELMKDLAPNSLDQLQTVIRSEA